VSSGDEVRLVVPAKPEFLGLARVTAGGLAGRLGFTYDQVEDLRLAIDEMCFALTGTKGKDGILELRFRLSPEGMTVVGEGHFGTSGPLSRSPLSEVILTALVDEHSFSDGADGPCFLLVKRQRARKDTSGSERQGEVSGP
jgi:hypothetical protein